MGNEAVIWIRGTCVLVVSCANLIREGYFGIAIRPMILLGCKSPSRWNGVM